MNWMAPEVLERAYDERSDMWSLGCIIMDATTCGFFDTVQSQSTLFELKHSAGRLEEVLRDVQKSYSKELCQLIRALLRCERLSIRVNGQIVLSHVPYIRVLMW